MIDSDKFGPGDCSVANYLNDRGVCSNDADSLC